MLASKVIVECNQITNWESFHNEFQRIFGFPEFYGRNMNAWIDCMSCLDNPEAEMSQIHCEEGKVVTIHLKNAAEFKVRNLELFDAIVECTAFVNFRRLEEGDEPILALSFHI